MIYHLSHLPPLSGNKIKKGHALHGLFLLFGFSASYQVLDLMPYSKMLKDY